MHFIVDLDGDDTTKIKNYTIVHRYIDIYNI